VREGVPGSHDANYGVDTGTVWKPAPFHEPILWRQLAWASPGAIA
jgi:hypothetical protein